MKILDGKAAAAHYNAAYSDEVKKYTAEGKRAPHLAAIIVGQNIASLTYVKNKIRTCKKIGYQSTLLRLEETITEEQLLSEIHRLNQDPDVDGILVQLPLPSHIDESKVILSIDPRKDVDGFHPTNVGKMVLNQDTFVSATPKGIINLLSYYDIDTTGLHCVVIGRSNIVGTPVSILLSRNAIPGNASVTLCHSRTTDLQNICLQADLIVVAIGRAEFLTANMVRPGTIIIDVGMNKKDDSTKKKGYRLVGDVDYDHVSTEASYITPVPGGVGPMTISALMGNTLKAYKKYHLKSNNE